MTEPQWAGTRGGAISRHPQGQLGDRGSEGGYSAGSCNSSWSSLTSSVWRLPAGRWDSENGSHRVPYLGDRGKMNKNTIIIIQHTYPTDLSCTRPCDKVVSKLQALLLGCSCGAQGAARGQTRGTDRTVAEGPEGFWEGSLESKRGGSVEVLWVGKLRQGCSWKGKQHVQDSSEGASSTAVDSGPLEFATEGRLKGGKQLS